MDALTLGRRIAEVRDDAGMTQEGLGRRVNLDRSAISRLEKGERKVNVPELVQIAAVLGRPLAYFVSEPVPAIVNRRRDTAHAHPTTRQLDGELEQFADDVRTLLAQGVLPSPAERPSLTLPRDHIDAEHAAATVRSWTGLRTGPITDLTQTSERLGLYVFAAALGQSGADGACVEVEHAGAFVGAAVLNGDVPAGRRRMTLAHELGHWLFGDAYDSEASLDSERMINSFAIHFLAPRAGVLGTWNKHPDRAVRDRALAVGATFRLSWSAAIGQLRNLDLIDFDQHRVLAEYEPSRGDYLRLGLTWAEELEAPYLSPSFTACVLNAYTQEHLTGDRTVELLRGTLDEAQLPTRDRGSLELLRRSFLGHDD
ncbi:MAG TPA: XRE family transcriptional regulator [Arachnia sp.]|nr:XRE family transcriptional regulator [Arachnia sp.]HMT84955.1 XRE family transcriptional regulator [Arachnia sp.]